MIGYIEGKIIDINDGSLIIKDNSGVGWEVKADTAKYLVGQDVNLFIHTNVRENDISLWGFSGASDLKLFKKLLDVSGVGTKTAFGLLTELGSAKVVSAIVGGDFNSLKTSGVGLKTAQKIVIELKDKLVKSGFKVDNQSIVNQTGKFGIDPDTIDALQSLGYRKVDIEEAYAKLSEVIEVKDLESSELIKKLLKYI